MQRNPTTRPVGPADPIYRIRQSEWVLAYRYHAGIVQGNFRYVDDMMSRLGMHSRSAKWQCDPISDDARRRIEDRIAGLPRVKL